MSRGLAAPQTTCKTTGTSGSHELVESPTKSNIITRGNLQPGCMVSPRTKHMVTMAMEKANKTAKAIFLQSTHELPSSKTWKSSVTNQFLAHLTAIVSLPTLASKRSSLARGSDSRTPTVVLTSRTRLITIRISSSNSLCVKCNMSVYQCLTQTSNKIWKGIRQTRALEEVSSFIGLSTKRMTKITTYA